MVDNRAAPVPSMTRARQDQSSIINHQSSIINHQSSIQCSMIHSDMNFRRQRIKISVYEATSKDRYACQQMIECYGMEDDMELMSERWRERDYITGTV
jgi:hypothetical protein